MGKITDDLFTQFNKWTSEINNTLDDVTKEMMDKNSFENRVLDVLKKYGIYTKDSSVGNKTKTFTIDEIIKVIESLEIKVTYSGEMIDKKELIEKFKNL
jgi:hypothetical protein